MSRFIDAHRGRFGVEPICRVLGVSASAYYQRGTGERSARVVEDSGCSGRSSESTPPTGLLRLPAHLVALQREGIRVGRDRVKRLIAPRDPGR